MQETREIRDIQELEAGDVVLIGASEFVVVATAKETGAFPLARNMKTGHCVSLSPSLSVRVVRHNEIVYASDIRKKKKEISESLTLLTELLAKAEEQFHGIVSKVTEVEGSYGSYDNDEYVR